MSDEYNERMYKVGGQPDLTMKFHSFAFIFLTPGFSPETNTVTSFKDGYRFKAVGIDLSSKYMVLDVARQLYKEGYQLIELCGGFGPQWSYKVSEELGMRVPVGGVYYGPEFRQQLVDLFRNYTVSGGGLRFQRD